MFDWSADAFGLLPTMNITRVATTWFLFHSNQRMFTTFCFFLVPPFSPKKEEKTKMKRNSRLVIESLMPYYLLGHALKRSHTVNVFTVEYSLVLNFPCSCLGQVFRRRYGGGQGHPHHQTGRAHRRELRTDLLAKEPPAATESATRTLLVRLPVSSVCRGLAALWQHRQVPSETNFDHLPCVFRWKTGAQNRSVTRFNQFYLYRQIFNSFKTLISISTFISRS